MFVFEIERYLAIWELDLERSMRLAFEPMTKVNFAMHVCELAFAMKLEVLDFAFVKTTTLHFNCGLANHLSLIKRSFEDVSVCLSVNSMTMVLTLIEISVVS